MNGQRNDPSTQLGKYRLLGELGRGGMAHVFLAMVTGPARFNKLVVIKEIQAELAHEPEFVMMFLDEARLAARLNHPNVVQTNEVGQEEYRFFMVMEYLEGQSLRTALRRIGRGHDAPFTLNMKLRVMCDALAGLHHAHELADFDGTPLGVVHRDVSPHNIFVTYSGQVKVLDFGIAKAFDSVSETSTGVLKGKVAYMAPEHARGDVVDRRADVYAAGIVLWEIATGDRLFHNMPQVAILNKLLSGDVPRLADVRPDIDPRLTAIITRALAYKPDDRYPTAAALARALEDLLRERGDMSTCREVGELLEGAFAEERARIHSLIEDQINRMNEPTIGQVAPVPLFDPQASSSSLMSPALPAGVTSPGVSITPPTMSGVSSAVTSAPPLGAQPPQRARWPWIAGPAAIAAVVAGFVMLRGDDGAAPSGAPSGEVATHTLRIESTPDGARVECNGSVVGTTPIDVRVGHGERPCVYDVVLDGHKPYTVERGPLSGDITIVASLLAEAPVDDASAPSATAAASTPRPRPRPTRRDTPPAPPPPPQPPKDDIRLRR